MWKRNGATRKTFSPCRHPPSLWIQQEMPEAETVLWLFDSSNRWFPVEQVSLMICPLPHFLLGNGLFPEGVMFKGIHPIEKQSRAGNVVPFTDPNLFIQHTLLHLIQQLTVERHSTVCSHRSAVRQTQGKHMKWQCIICRDWKRSIWARNFAPITELCWVSAAQHWATLRGATCRSGPSRGINTPSRAVYGWVKTSEIKKWIYLHPRLLFCVHQQTEGCWPPLSAVCN